MKFIVYHSGFVATNSERAYISPAFQARYGYPALTPPVRAKILGLNATKPYNISADDVRKYARIDRIACEKLADRERREPRFLTPGPKSRREFLNLLSWNGSERA